LNKEQGHKRPTPAHTAPQWGAGLISIVVGFHALES